MRVRSSIIRFVMHSHIWQFGIPILCSPLMAATRFPLGILRPSYLLLLAVCITPLLSQATDTVSRSQPLSGDRRLVSQGGKFAVGFFQPVGGAPDKWYLAIWYNKISKLTPVWIANRVTPISDPKSSELRISEDGNMVLFNQLKSPIWSTNITSYTSKPTVGVILDTGNFVLTPASNFSNFLWQSFDEPTNVWLSGAKLGRNKITSLNRRLVSWKTSTDPSPGFYSVEIDLGGSNQFLHKWNNSEIYWTTGSWTGTIFSGVPEMALYPKSLLTYYYVNNDQENYFMYQANESKATVMFSMETAGQVKAASWMESVQDWVPFFAIPKAQCSVYSVCGSFAICSENAFTFCSCLRGFSKQYGGDGLYGTPTEGCTRNVRLQCGSTSLRKENVDGFFALAVAKLPDNARSTAAASVNGCKQDCLNNCSCTAYAYSEGCSLWYGELINLVSPADGSLAQSIYIRLAASEFPSPTKTRKALIIGGATVGGILVAALVLVGLRLILRKRSFSEVNKVDGSLVVFKYRYLQYVTKNFSERLGKGSFGSVYKGMFADGTLVAVKKLDGVSQGEKEFRAEVSTIGTIQHVNLIWLLGFCSERSMKILVYEYMPSGSLDRYLFGSSPVALSWNIRYQIALGIAKGLAYLHDKCRNCIIHCDIKPENVLLDASFMPKIADFGLAKLVGRDFSRVLTTMRGTIGYLAPEWISGMAITAKADVFSYGMMLFEIISGKRNVEEHQQGAETFFPALVAMRLPGGNVQTLLDSKLTVNASFEEVERACKVACWCVQDDENSRPTMGKVVQILEGLVDINFPPVPRYLQIIADRSKFSSHEAPR